MSQGKGYISPKIFSFVQFQHCQQQNARRMVIRQASTNTVCCNLSPLEYSLVISSFSDFSSKKKRKKPQENKIVNEYNM